MQLFNIMPCRLAVIKATIEGYARSRVPLVTFNDVCNGNVNVIGPSGITEEHGVYYYIPALVQVTGLTAEAAVLVFYGCLVAIGCLAGMIGSWRYCDTGWGRVISVAAVGGVSVIIAGISDIYVVMGVSAVALVPWALCLMKRPNPTWVLIFCTIAGLTISISDSIRASGGTGVAIFIVLALVFNGRYSRRIRLAGVTLLAVGALPVFLFFTNLLEERDTYLRNVGYQGALEDQRALWHNVYYSLGFLQNPYGIEPSDSHSERRAKAIEPNVLLYSEEYETVLRNEVIRVIRTDPVFFVTTVFAKIGVSLMYILMFGNVGLLCALVYRREFLFTMLFASGIGFNMLFGIAATPDYTYFTGLFAFSTLYGVYSIDSALDDARLKRLARA